MSVVVKQIHLKKNMSFQLVQGDITRENTDAIINAANAHLQHGAGVAGAIARQGGSQIQKESDEWVKEHGPVTHQTPAYTSAGDLPSHFIIHAVGPVWGTGDEQLKLAQAVKGSLELAGNLELNSLSMPAISTGIFGFPKELAARVIITAVQNFFSDDRSTSLELVRLVLFDDITLTAFTNTWEEIFNE